jgi:orotate phosphoribosyltransferase
VPVRRKRVKQHEAMKILEEVGAVVTGSHIVYTSGLHGSAYVNKDAIYPHVRLVSRLCRSIARRFIGNEVDAVIAPAIGGVVLSQWTAYHLTDVLDRDVLALYAEKVEVNGRKSFAVTRGYARHVIGKRILVVEDILTTGGSVRKVIEAVRRLGGDVVGLGALCNRGNVKPEDVGGVPDLESLVSVFLDAWPEDSCPLCARGVPINTEVGKGCEFLARHGRSA